MSIEYSSSSRKLSSGGRYESSSTYEGSGLTSSYSRRESGSRLESSKYESGGALEGIASSRYESKYSSRTDGGSKYGIESSYESKSEAGSKFGIEYDSASKIDSIASKYGIEANSESKTEKSSYAIEGDSASKIDSIASKYGLESKYESKVESSAYGTESDTTSKIDSIASKYASKRFSIEASADGDKVEGVTSTTESSYEAVKNGGSSYESRRSKKAIANGSVSTGYESTTTVSKSESQDGKPIFTKTLEGQNIERKSLHPKVEHLTIEVDTLLVLVHNACRNLTYTTHYSNHALDIRHYISSNSKSLYGEFLLFKLFCKTDTIQGLIKTVNSIVLCLFSVRTLI